MLSVQTLTHIMIRCSLYEIEATSPRHKDLQKPQATSQSPTPDIPPGQESSTETPTKDNFPQLAIHTKEFNLG